MSFSGREQTHITILRDGIYVKLLFRQTIINVIYTKTKLLVLLRFIPYFTNYRSMWTIGRIAAFWVKFGENTKIGRSIP